MLVLVVENEGSMLVHAGGHLGPGLRLVPRVDALHAFEPGVAEVRVRGVAGFVHLTDPAFGHAGLHQVGLLLEAHGLREHVLLLEGRHVLVANADLGGRADLEGLDLTPEPDSLVGERGVAVQILGFLPADDCRRVAPFLLAVFLVHDVAGLVEDLAMVLGVLHLLLLRLDGLDG